MSDPLFLFGSLRDADLFAIVAGVPLAQVPTTAAALVDHRAERAANEAYPVLVRAAGARAEGLLVHGLPEATVARISFYETTDYRLGPVEVHAGGATIRARCYHATEILPTSGEWWNLDHWSVSGKPLALHAAGLAMAHYGRVGLADVAALWPEIYREARRRLEAEAVARRRIA